MGKPRQREEWQVRLHANNRRRTFRVSLKALRLCLPEK